MCNCKTRTVMRDKADGAKPCNLVQSSRAFSRCRTGAPARGAGLLKIAAFSRGRAWERRHVRPVLARRCSKYEKVRAFRARVTARGMRHAVGSIPRAVTRPARAHARRGMVNRIISLSKAFCLSKIHGSQLHRRQTQKTPARESHRMRAFVIATSAHISSGYARWPRRRARAWRSSVGLPPRQRSHTAHR